MIPTMGEATLTAEWIQVLLITDIQITGKTDRQKTGTGPTKFLLEFYLIIKIYSVTFLATPPN
jgi:hypothetical protein